ncbi:MAG: hypothetical protein CAF45_005090 [Nitrospira sp. CG24E]|nr:MAG: hypothetical protein CAF45_005090 [Nitrospira sp. CG24E]
MMDHAVINGPPPSRPSEADSINDIPRDGLLPQLAEILNSAAMKGQLQERMFASTGDRERFLIRFCEIVQIRYKPESSCMVSYRLEIEDAVTGNRGEQILCGRAYPQGRSQSQWEKAGAQALVQPRFGNPLVHLPELEMVLWSFPNDRKMHTLPDAIDPIHSTPEFLPDWLALHLGTGWQVINAIPRVVHYVGEHTCTVRTSVDLVHRSMNERRTMTIFGKTYYNGEGAETDRVMRQLWDSEARQSGRLAVAQPLWYDARLLTLWQLGIQGATLENCATESQEFVPLLMEAARAIAALHAMPLSHIRSVTLPDLVAKLKSVTAMLIRRRPSCQPVLVPLVNRLIAQAETIPLHPTATLHGDLHLKNLFLTQNKVALIDLDNICEGPPCQDIGSFVAGLFTRALAKGTSPSQVASCAQTFIHQYSQLVPWQTDEPVVAWFTAVALVTERSSRCVTRLKEGRLAMVNSLIDLADRISKTRSLDSAVGGGADRHERTIVP